MVIVAFIAVHFSLLESFVRKQLPNEWIYCVRPGWYSWTYQFSFNKAEIKFNDLIGNCAEWLQCTW